MQLLDGKATAEAIKDELKIRVKSLASKGVTPGLATVLVGDDPASKVYVASKHRDCAAVGIHSVQKQLPASATFGEIAEVIDELNADDAIHGYIVQLPLPAGISQQAVLERIDPDKDADGLHPVSLGRLVLGEKGALPCTPRGIVELLRRYDVPLDGAEVVVVGRGITVGRPLGLLLTRRSENATVTLCHTGTRDLAEHTRRADVIVVAAGKAGLLTADMVRPGAAVLDVGVTRELRPDGKAKILGDVAPEVAAVAGHLAPMPGGVGPMTRAMLLTNVVERAEQLA